MIRRKINKPLLGGSAALAAVALLPAAQAQSSDALIDKLVEKGILTVQEANDLRAEVDKDFTKAYAVKSGMQDWVTAWKLNGDFRGRFEGFYSDNPNFVDRNRWRYRLRVGLTAAMKNDIEVGSRLASGEVNGDPISTNQTLQDNASKKPVTIDLAYAKWSPLNTAEWAGSFTLGKMDNPFVLSDMLFDPDYTPEGAAQQLSHNLSSRQALKLNLGEFILDELGASSKDPYLVGAQLRLESTWSPKLASSLGVGFLSILGEESLTSSAVPDVNRGNRRNVASATSLTYPAVGFDTLVADGALTYTLDAFPHYPGPFPIKVFGEWLHNGSADGQNDGYHVGITFGKSGKKGAWDITYRWKELGGDAWWEELADSDFGAYYQNALAAPLPKTARTYNGGYFAGTNVRGHILKASYSVFDSLTLGVTWFSTSLIEEYRPGTASGMNRLQVDAIHKF